MELTYILPLLLCICLSMNNVSNNTTPLETTQGAVTSVTPQTESTALESTNSTSNSSSESTTASSSPSTTHPTATTTIVTKLTTAASTSTSTNKPGDACLFYLNQTDCCKHADDQKCQFYFCNNQTDKTNHTGCHSNESLDWNTTCQPNTIKNVCNSFSTSTIVTSTEPTKSSDSTGNQGDKSSHQQHFDGASFIGGIVLCMGIVALIFFGLKFYKSRSEANYRTL